MSQWETGLIERIGAEHLAACAASLCVSLDWLLSGDTEVSDSLPPAYRTEEQRVLLNAWTNLTASQRAAYLERILADSEHNQALLRELIDRS